MQDEEKQDNEHKEEIIHEVQAVSGLYENWFLEYASYVILERAVPAIEDGFKPVQRRIMHALKEMDDGRFNKVANIIGQTMQYHPHGDASIADAMVNIGQKDLLIETQGNWGDVRTGDGAAAPRYIEARLSKFALDVVYNPQTTDWQLSYDGRKKEPVVLPVKFPLLLAQGVEGIAVGLSTKVLPHNFIEIIQACIALCKGRSVRIYPDFFTGGYADFSDYNDGLRGGKIRVRARIEELDKKTLIIKDIPFSTTTTSLIESIVKASEKGKIKIKKVVDNTAKDVEIEIQLAPGQSPDIAIDALYAFTDCEVSISPNACVIIEDKPKFVTVSEILVYSNNQTISLLNQELEIKKGELLEKLLFSSLEKIFIENRIYRDIEECETWEAVISTIDKGLTPFKPQFYREITQEDIVKLTEIRIKRISKFDAFKADELMRKLGDELKEVEYNLAHIVDYTIKYYQNLLDKYGKGRERKTEIKAFDTISATVVAANNQKLYVNRAEGFIGYGIKKDEFITDCSDLDDIIIFRKDGHFKVVKIGEKVFVGKDILHAAVFRKDDRTVYNMIYLDAKSGRSMVKRFQIGGVTRDKDYDLTSGNKGSKTTYLEARANGESEVVTVQLTPSSTARVKIFDYDFADLAIKGRSSQGNILTTYPVKSIKFKFLGASSLGGVDIYYDDAVGRLNTDERGKLLGNFHGDDAILVITKDGNYEITSFELTNRYDINQTLLIEKFDPERVVSAVYYDGSGKTYYVKRFKIETTTLGKKFCFISEERGSTLTVVSTDKQAQLELDHVKPGEKTSETTVYDFDMLIDVKGWKAIGNKMPVQKFKKIKVLAPKVENDMVANGKSTDKKNLEVGDSIELDVKSDKEQLGLF